MMRKRIGMMAALAFLLAGTLLFLEACKKKPPTTTQITRADLPCSIAAVQAPAHT